MLTYLFKWLGRRIGQFALWQVKVLVRIINYYVPGFNKAWAWVVGIVLSLITISNWAIDFTWESLLKLVELIGHIGLRDSSDVNALVDSVASTLSIINRFMPLAEAFVMTEALTVTMLACWLYRFIKSLVPTWS
jgi:hypothetical protein